MEEGSSKISKPMPIGLFQSERVERLPYQC